MLQAAHNGKIERVLDSRLDALAVV